MKKKNALWMLAAILFCGLTAGVLSACGDDDDKADEKQDSMEALCHLMVSEDVLKVADVTVHYLDAKGQEVTEPMNTLEWKKSWKTITLPARVGVWAQLTPKANAASLQDSYQLKTVTTAGYIFNSAKGGEWVEGHTEGNPSTAAEEVKADNVAEWCNNVPKVRFEVDKQGLCIYSGGNKNSLCEWIMNLFGYDINLCYINGK